MIQVVFLFAMFASIFGLSKASLEYSEPYFLVGSRMLLAGVLLLGYRAFIKPREFLLSRKELLSLTLLGFFNIYLTNILEIVGLKTIASSKACLIYSVSPFLSAFFSFFVFSEILSKKKWVGMSLGFAGLMFLMLEGMVGDSHQDVIKHLSQFHVGDFLLFGAVISNVYGWILLKNILTQTGKSAVFVNGVSMLIGGFIALAHSYMAGETWAPIPVFDMQMFLRNTFLICMISNIICYNLYGHLLKTYSATFLSFAGLISPLFASLFGWLFLDEKISIIFLISFLFFMFGLIVFHREEGREELQKS
ncbi:MAG: DMT family transporter [Oligoflexales bacterium]|nr:DMT family transporter [Oligoflexales bacterium]